MVLLYGVIVAEPSHDLRSHCSADVTCLKCRAHTVADDVAAQGVSFLQPQAVGIWMRGIDVA